MTKWCAAVIQVHLIFVTKFCLTAFEWNLLCSIVWIFCGPTIWRLWGHWRPHDFSLNLKWNIALGFGVAWLPRRSYICLIQKTGTLYSFWHWLDFESGWFYKHTLKTDVSMNPCRPWSMEIPTDMWWFGEVLLHKYCFDNFAWYCFQIIVQSCICIFVLYTELISENTMSIIAFQAHFIVEVYKTRKIFLIRL